MADQKKQAKISEKLMEASRISYFEAILILISVAFGVGYISVMQTKGSTIYFYMIGINFICGALSCYMLNEVKKAQNNKLGSYHEIAYYYT